MSAADIENLRRENEALEKQIAELKLTLGITQTEQESEKNHIRRLFAAFDTDSSGFIERGEFQVLTARLGLFFTPDSLQAALTAIDVSGDGKISFDEFYKWLSSVDKAALNASSMAARDLMALKVKLQSKAYLASAGALKRTLSAKYSANPVSQNGKKFKLHFGLSVQDSDSSENGVVVSYYNQADRVASFVESSCSSADHGVIGEIQLALKPGIDAELVGELAGSLGPILDVLPDMLNLPLEHEEMYDEENHILRIVIRSSVDLESNITEAFAGLKPQAFLDKLDVYLRFPRGVTDPDWMLYENLKTNVGIDAEIDGLVFDVVKELVRDQGRNKTDFLIVPFFRMLETFSFDFKAFDPASELSGEGSLSRYANTFQIPAQVIQDKLREALAPIASSLPAEAAPIYSIVQQTVVGVRKVQAQVGSVGVEVTIKGLDIVPLLPSV